MRVYTCVLSLGNHGGDTIKMRPGRPPPPQAVSRQKIVFLLALGVDTDACRDDVRLSCQSSGDCPVHEVPRLVPAEPAQPGATLNVALFQHVDGEAGGEHA